MTKDLFADDPKPKKPSLPKLPKSPHVVFDIETSPVWQSESIDDAKAFCRPFGLDFDTDSVEYPGEFDPRSVKTGNLKDQAKIDAKIADAKKQHEILASRHGDDVAAAERNYWTDVIQSAPLSPVFGKVAAIGYTDDGQVSILSGKEFELLSIFWDRFFLRCRDESRNLIGWNINAFDVPFMAARSAILGVKIPPILERGKWLSSAFTDLMLLYNAGQRQSPWKLNSSRAKRVAKAMGFGRPDDVLDDGAQWWKLWYSGDDASRERAEDYLIWDCVEEALIAERLGVL